MPYVLSIPGKIVKVEKHHQAKIAGSNKYKGFGIAFPLFLAEAVFIAILFGYFQSTIQRVLWANILMLPTFFIEAGIVYYFWFCLEYDYNPIKHGRLVIGFQLPVIINILILYLTHQPIFTWPFG